MCVKLKKYFKDEPFTYPEKQILTCTAKDFLDEDVEEKYYINKPYEPVDMNKRVCTMIIENNLEMCRRVYNSAFKMCTLTCISGGGQQKKVFDNGRPRKLTEIEYERLQGLPDNFTNVEVNGRKISYSKRCSLMGNGWNEPTIEHIFRGLKNVIENHPDKYSVLFGNFVTDLENI